MLPRTGHKPELLRQVARGAPPGAEPCLIMTAGLKVAAALGGKRLTIKGDLQLLLNFSNKVYEPRDEHMGAYLAEVRRMEK